MLAAWLSAGHKRRWVLHWIVWEIGTCLYWQAGSIRFCSGCPTPQGHSFLPTKRLLGNGTPMMLTLGTPQVIWRWWSIDTSYNFYGQNHLLENSLFLYLSWFDMACLSGLGLLFSICQIVIFSTVDQLPPFYICQSGKIILHFAK